MSLFRRAVAANIVAPALRRRVQTTIYAPSARASVLLHSTVRPSVSSSAMNAARRHVHARAVSTSSGMPKFMLRLIRIPALGVTAAGGLYAYTNYKVDGTSAECPCSHH